MIKILSSNVINKISAGEVVERPASVVKELVENSIDAGSKTITVVIKNAGKELIKIIDDGSGIPKSDFDNLFHKHATSKISEVEDLDEIVTMGFRGEALASISSVADIEINTKSETDEIGSHIFREASAGKVTVKPSAISNGTEVLVRNLFLNIPARLKFLKTDATENKQIFEIINKIIIANPNITFKLDVDGIRKEYYKTTYQERVKTFLKVEERDIIELSISNYLNAKVYCIHPSRSPTDRKNQYIFVNKRAVQDNLISKAVRDGYGTFLMKHQFPGFCIFIEIDPKLVDVNVHPRKTEVRFSDSAGVYKSIRFGLENQLVDYLKKETLQKISSSDYETPQIKQEIQRDSKNNSIQPTQGSISKSSVQIALDFSKEILQTNNEVQEENASYTTLSSERKINLDTSNATQLLNSYILTANENDILIIDQHAASERYFYERYLQSIKNKKIPSKVLLVPEIIELEPEDQRLVNENLSVFNQLGFELEEFGKDEIRITCVPDFVRLTNFSKILKLMIQEIIENKTSENITEKIMHDIAASLACHTAVRFGDRLTKQEIIQILENLMKCEDPYNCPHGRPIIYDMNSYDIEKKFKRCGL